MPEVGRFCDRFIITPHAEGLSISRYNDGPVGLSCIKDGLRFEMYQGNRGFIWAQRGCPIGDLDKQV